MSVEPHHDPEKLPGSPDSTTMIYDPDTEEWVPYTGDPAEETPPPPHVPPIIVEPPPEDTA